MFFVNVVLVRHQRLVEVEEHRVFEQLDLACFLQPVHSLGQLNLQTDEDLALGFATQVLDEVPAFTLVEFFEEDQVHRNVVVAV